MNDTLSAFLLLLVPGLPLMLAPALMSPRLRPVAIYLAPLGALPALVVSLWLTPGITLELPWLLIGSRLGLDETARVFLFFTALLWLAASVYTMGYFRCRSSRRRFLTWFLFAMAGNLGLILARDMLIFYTFFALMSLASYGLVVHERTLQALRAGRVYIVLAVVGEVLLFAAFVLAAVAASGIEFEAVRPAVAGSQMRDLIVGLMLLGFGIKAGVIGLHVWLPLAHPVAPTPASAVLSGAMIAAGLLGWLRVLPLGETALSGWGGAMIAAGVTAFIYAVLVGLLQSNPKTVLAYCSISKMGIMTIGVGLGLVAPDNWPFISSAVLVFALHHGLAKGALFLGVGMAATPLVSKRQRNLLIAGLLLPALSLAGAPLTSGMIAKNLMKAQAMSAESAWGDWLQILLPWGSVATSMLMARFLYLVWPRHERASGAHAIPETMWLSWLILVLAVSLSPWFVPLADEQGHWTLVTLISAFWPVAFGAGLAVCVWLIVRHKWFSWSFRIPPGDVLLIVEDRLCSLVASARLFGFETLPRWRTGLLSGWGRIRDRSGSWSVLVSGEKRFARWVVGTTLFLVLGMLSVFLAAY